jgi:hypothetical protein
MTNVRNRQTCTVGYLDVVHPAIVLLEVKTSQIARQVICGAIVEMPDRGIGVVAGRCRIPGALVVIVAGLKLRIEPVPAV